MQAWFRGVEKSSTGPLGEMSGDGERACAVRSRLVTVISVVKRNVSFSSGESVCEESLRAPAIGKLFSEKGYFEDLVG